MKTIRQRKKFFLWKSSQPRLLAGNAIIFIVLLVTAGAVFASIANRDLTGTYFKAHLAIRNMLEILIPSLVVVNVLGLVASMILAVFFTHRIAGPVYRLCGILRGIGEGNLVQVVRFRKGDELKELDDAATEMITALQDRVRSLQSLCAELNRQIESDLGSGTQPNVRVIRQKAKELDEQLAAFRLPSTADRWEKK
jgi:nitrogen fixation/metabolism regulation signal transduction histidine kinase